MPQPYFVKGLIGKVLAYGGLQIRKYIPHGLQIPADKTLRIIFSTPYIGITNTILTMAKQHTYGSQVSYLAVVKFDVSEL